MPSLHECPVLIWQHKNHSMLPWLTCDALNVCIRLQLNGRSLLPFHVDKQTMLLYAIQNILMCAYFTSCDADHANCNL